MSALRSCKRGMGASPMRDVKAAEDRACMGEAPMPHSLHTMPVVALYRFTLSAFASHLKMFFPSFRNGTASHQGLLPSFVRIGLGEY